MRYLLDTNVVVWLLLGDRSAIPQDVAEAISDPRAHVLVSAASAWEIAIKRSLGKLRIGENWRSALGHLEVDQLPVTLDHAAAVQHLPWHHRDPFDRLLLAQATVERATLVTSDRTLDQYDVTTWWGGA